MFGDTVPVRQYTIDNAHEMAIAASARRKRLYGAAPVVIKAAPEPEKPSLPMVATCPTIPAFVERDWLLLGADASALGIVRRPPPNRANRIRSVICEVAEVYGIRPDAIRSAARFRDLVVPRQVAMWIACRFVPEASTTMLGQSVGGRDHTTVIHGRRKVQALVEKLEISPAEETVSGWARAIRTALAIDETPATDAELAQVPMGPR